MLIIVHIVLWNGLIAGEDDEVVDFAMVVCAGQPACKPGRGRGFAFVTVVSEGDSNVFSYPLSGSLL
jgi:hypothetical protein